MAFEKIGLDAVFRDAGFNAGITAYQKGIGAATTATDKGAHAITTIGRVMSGALVVGVGAAVTAFGTFTAAAKIGLDAAMKWGESLDKLGDMFGMSGAEASKWATYFSHFGVPIEEAGQQLNFLTRGLAETTKVGADGKKTLTPFGEALKKLGVSATDNKGKIKDLNTILPQMIAAFNKLPAGIEKSNLAMELFGARGGSKMLDALSASAAEVERLSKLTKLYGLDLSTDTVNAIEDFGFALNDTQLGIKGFWTQIGVHLLPIARKLVDFINKNILPALVKWAKDNMPAIIRALDKFVGIIKKDVLPIVQRLVDAFQKGGFVGIFSQIIIEIEKAIPTIQATLQVLGARFWDWLTGKGGALEQVGAKLGQVAIAIKAWLITNSPAILAAFETLKTNFWNWLTGKGGAIAQAGTRLGEVLDAIKKWISENGPAIAKKFDELKTQFWEWLTGKNGVISQIPEKISEFADSVNTWATGEGNAVLSDAGIAIGRAIGGGIATLLGADETSTGMSNSVSTAASKSANAFVSIGRAIGGGIVQGIYDSFANIDWFKLFTSGLKPLPPGFPFGTPAPTTSGGGGGGGGSTGGDRHSGGPILQSGRYNLLAGEYVIPAPNISNSRVNNFNFSHTWNSPVSPSTQQMTESMVRRVTQQEIREVMRKI